MKRHAALFVVLVGVLVFTVGCAWLEVLLPPPQLAGPIYATDVVGGDICTAGNQYCDRRQAVGVPDETSPWTGRFVSLGGEPGFIIATMATCFSDGVGADIRVYEVGSTQGGKDQKYDVYISKDLTSWIQVADDIRNESGAAFSSIDIAPHSGEYRYIKIVDQERRSGGTSPGSDIDAIEALFPRECGSAQPLLTEAAVIRVIDGDTVDLDREVLGKTRVRYTGIDTSELTPSVECYADEATARNFQLVGDKNIWLELDERTVDNIGRLLAYVHTAPDLTLDSMVNYRLLLEGYAKIYKVEENWRYVDEFRNAQIEAVANRRGMWSECGGYADADIVIAAIQFWSSDEFVVILNRGAQAVNLNGWTISDEHGNSYVFQGTSDIPAWSSTNDFTQSIRTVHSGPGTNQEIGNDLQWTNSYIWNETGDTAYLRNPAGDVVCSYEHKGF